MTADEGLHRGRALSPEGLFLLSLFVWGCGSCWWAFSTNGMWTAHCGGFSYCRSVGSGRSVVAIYKGASS